MLRCSNIAMRYGDSRVLHDVSFSVEPGRMTAIIAISRKRNLRLRGRGGCVCSGQSIVSGNFSTPPSDRCTLGHARIVQPAHPANEHGGRMGLHAHEQASQKERPSGPAPSSRTPRIGDQIRSVRPASPSSFTILPTSCEWSRCAINSASSVSTITRFSTPTSATNFFGLKT